MEEGKTENEQGIPIITTEIILWGKNGLAEETASYSSPKNYNLIGVNTSNNLHAKIETSKKALFPRNSVEFTIIMYEKIGDGKNAKEIGKRMIKIPHKVEKSDELNQILIPTIKEMLASYYLGANHLIFHQGKN